jgi:chorismate dehydratase
MIRIGAVGYLNARPLTWALDRDPERWRVRYDVPSVCAALLHQGDTDLGLIPSIEYLQSTDYRFVPGVGIGSRGPSPDLAAMTRTCDAGLLIGDPAFDADHRALALTKIDLGEAWTMMTGRPFVYAAWTGRAGVVTPDDVRALQEAQDEGVRCAAEIAAEYGAGDPVRTERAAIYLRDNVKYALGPEEAAGLQMFLDYAADLGVAPRRRPLEFFDE